MCKKILLKREICPGECAKTVRVKTNVRGDCCQKVKDKGLSWGQCGKEELEAVVEEPTQVRCGICQEKRAKEKMDRVRDWQANVNEKGGDPNRAD